MKATREQLLAGIAASAAGLLLMSAAPSYAQAQGEGGVSIQGPSITGPIPGGPSVTGPIEGGPSITGPVTQNPNQANGTPPSMSGPAAPASEAGPATNPTNQGIDMPAATTPPNQGQLVEMPNGTPNSAGTGGVDGQVPGMSLDGSMTLQGATTLSTDLAADMSSTDLLVTDEGQMDIFPTNPDRDLFNFNGTDQLTESE